MLAPAEDRRAVSVIGGNYREHRPNSGTLDRFFAQEDDHSDVQRILDAIRAKPDYAQAPIETLDDGDW